MLVEDTRAKLRQGFALIQSGQMNDAYSLLLLILKQEPANAEAWWLMAHAAPTANDAVLACQEVLRLRPGYEPALTLLHAQELAHIRDLAANSDRREAYAALKELLRAQPDNVEALWLAAQYAPMRSEAIAACQRVLALQPNHLGAQDMLADHQKLLQTTLVEKEKIARRAKPKRKRGRTLILVALVLGTLGSLMTVIALTGNTFGLPIGSQFSGKTQVSGLGTKPNTLVGSLVVGATQDYQFTGIANSEVLVLVKFPLVGGATGNAVKVYDADKQLLAIGDSRGQGTVTLLLPVSKTGSYTLRLVGTSGKAQGVYVLQLSMFDMGFALPNGSSDGP